jgi:hypothetical protein
MLERKGWPAILNPSFAPEQNMSKLHSCRAAKPTQTCFSLTEHGHHERPNFLKPSNTTRRQSAICTMITCHQCCVESCFTWPSCPCATHVSTHQQPQEFARNSRQRPPMPPASPWWHLNNLLYTHVEGENVTCVTTQNGRPALATPTNGCKMTCLVHSEPLKPPETCQINSKFNPTLS